MGALPKAAGKSQSSARDECLTKRFHPADTTACGNANRLFRITNESAMTDRLINNFPLLFSASVSPW